MVQVALEFPGVTLCRERTAEKKTLQGRIERFNAKCQQADDEGQQIKDIPESKWTAATVERAAKLRGRNTDLLGEEIVIREEIDAYLANVEAVDTPASYNAAIAEFDSAKVDVRRSLVSIGFLAEALDWHILSRHPRIAAAMQLRDSLAGALPSRDSRSDNLSAIDRLRSDLAELKRRAVALVA
jgi:hypothetical protein